MSERLRLAKAASDLRDLLVRWHVLGKTITHGEIERLLESTLWVHDAARAAQTLAPIQCPDCSKLHTSMRGTLDNGVTKNRFFIHGERCRCACHDRSP